MIGLIIISIVIVTIVIMTINHQHVRMHEIYATHARDWDQLRNKVTSQRDRLLSMEIPPEDDEAARFRDQVVERYNTDIRRLTDRIELNTSMVPHRLRKKLKCPIV